MINDIMEDPVIEIEKNTKRSIQNADRFIVEFSIPEPYSVASANTVQQLQQYLATNPHPNYRLVGFDFEAATYTLIWERNEKNIRNRRYPRFV
jgi:hypothetical protein